MLTGYIPGAEAVQAVGRIAEDLKAKARSTPGRFFWVLDPVMGDNGRLYVADDVVPAYKSLLPHADLILPNQFEAEYVQPSFPRNKPPPPPPGPSPSNQKPSPSMLARPDKADGHVPLLPPSPADSSPTSK